MYSNKFVMSLLLNGVPQQEKENGTIIIPFNSEYELRFHNKHSYCRAVVKIYIDGENVSGGGYVINTHSYIDIKRHSNVDRAFKFVDLNSFEAMKAGKNGPNDQKIKGTIEARFYLEKKYECPKIIEKHYHHDYPIYPTPWKVPPYTLPDIWCCSVNTNSEQYSQANCYVNSYTQNLNSTETKDGCTVEGQSTGQSFYNTNIDLEDTFTSIKIFLQGYNQSQTNIVNRTDIKYCDKCGTKVLKKNSKFCHVCGNKL